MKSFEEFNGKFEFIATIFLVFSMIFLASSLLSVYSKFYLKKTNLESEYVNKQNLTSAETKAKRLL